MDKNEHEKYLAEESVSFTCKETSSSRKYICPVSGNKYRFFRNQALIVKDRRDIEHFREADHLFDEVGAKPKKDNSKSPTAEELVEETKPKTASKKAAKKTSKGNKTKSLNTKRS